MTDTTRPVHVARFFTIARKFPILIGKLPNGGRIWGGPYTMGQAVIGMTALIVGWNTRSWWSTQSIVGDLGILVAVAATSVFLARKIPSTRRNAANVLIDAQVAITVPAAGRYRGKPIRIRKPHLVAGKTIAMLLPGEPSVAHLPATTSAPRAASTPVVVVQIPLVEETPAVPSQLVEQPLPANVIPIRSRHVSSVERLLEQARQKETK